MIAFKGCHLITDNKSPYTTLSEPLFPHFLIGEEASCLIIYLAGGWIYQQNDSIIKK